MRDSPGAGREPIGSPGLGCWGAVSRALVAKLYERSLEQGSTWSTTPRVTTLQALTGITGRMHWGMKLGLEGFVNKQG